MLSTTSWRQPYPSVGQFAMTKSEEVVAAGPNGLFHFRRIRGLAATPWSEPHPFPSVGVTLNELTVSGLALYSGEDSQRRPRLHVYCVSGGLLYNFYLADKNNSSFILDIPPHLGRLRVTGNPTVVGTRSGQSSSDRWSLIVPCQSGGLLHMTGTNSISSYGSPASTNWEAVDHLATDLGIISAVSVTVVYDLVKIMPGKLVAVCISSGQLNVVEGSFCQYGSRRKWDGKTSARILHPGEVTGNPVLITDRHNGETQLDLLVPSAEGGIFHFVCAQSAPNDWHMIGRLAFPQNIPPPSCLSFYSLPVTYKKRELYALVQICGLLYHIKTTNDKFPWHNARLNPIVYPGPFFE
ncbi:hypothetical protein ABKA04_004094 [Annulohypoxylon sp. FPYF3050]